MELWAALVGALVGGGLSAAASWWTTKTQWDREREARLVDRLDAGVSDLMSGLAEGEVDTSDPERAMLRLSDDRILRLIVLVRARAIAVGSQHFAALLRDATGAEGKWHEWIDMEQTRLLTDLLETCLVDRVGLEQKKPQLSDFTSE